MSTASGNRYPRSFVVCFHCNENFRSLSTLLKHHCPLEKKRTLDWESHSTASDTNEVDLSQDDWAINDVDLSQDDWDPYETVSEANKCDVGQENSVSSTSESNVSNVCENSLSATEMGLEQSSATKSNSASEEICHLVSDATEKQYVEILTDVIREGITKSVSDAPKMQSSETNLGIMKEVSDASEMQSSEANSDIMKEVSDESETQLSEANSDIMKEVSGASETQSSGASSDVIREYSDLASNASEKQQSKATSDVIKEVTNIASDPSKKQLSVTTSGTEQKTTDMEPDEDEFNRVSPDLVSKVLQYYEKQTKDSPDSCCKSPAEMEFPSSHSPSPTVESSSPRHDNMSMDCSSTDVCDKGLLSSTNCDIFEEDVKQNELDALKQGDGDSESHDSDASYRPSPPDSDSSDMFSRSSSVGMDLDSLEWSDDQAESNDSDVCSTIPLLGKKSNDQEQGNVQAELEASKISGMSLPEENLNLKYGSVKLKSCYVKVQDIFKSLSKKTKLSPKKIFSWKRKYHVCDVCNKFFRLRGDLNIHYLIHTTVKPYVCKICNKSFIKEGNLFQHHLTHTIKKDYKCYVCKKAFPKRSLLLRHELIHTKLKPFACDKCDKRYSVKSSLYEHYLSHSDERPFVCEICNASFNNKRYLRKHYYRHENGKGEYACDLCFKVFKRKQHFDEHYNFHMNDKPHKCTICGEKFHYLLTLNKHFSLAHKTEKENIFQEKIKSMVDSLGGKDPVIQRIEKATIVDKNEITIKKIETSAAADKGGNTPIMKNEKSSVVDKGEKTTVKNIEKSSIVNSKGAVPYSTRRKSFIPKKYLQPD